MFNPIYLHYEGSASKSIPVAGTVAAGLDATSDAVLVGGLYTFPETVLGGWYSVGAYLPYVWISAQASIDSQVGSRRRKDSVSGVGDLTLIPAMVAWKSDDLQYSALLQVNAPTGRYETGRLANPGLNYWSFVPTVGVSYNNQKTGLNAALYAGVALNTQNSATDYHSGSVLNLEGSVQQLLPAGPGFLGIGAEAFYLQQVSGDSGSGAHFGDFKGRTSGMGPVITYILPHGRETFVAEVRWLPELNVENRLKGDYIWAKFVYQF